MDPEKTEQEKVRVSKKKNSAKKQKFSLQKYSHEIFFIIVVVACISLLSVVVILTGEYTKVLNEQVESKAMLNATDAVSALNERMDGFRYQAAMIGNTIASTNDTATFESACNQSVALTQYLTKIVYCKNGELYLPSGEPYHGDDALIRAAALDTLTVVGVVLETEDIMDRMAICVPTPEHTVSDAVILFYATTSLRDLKNEIPEEALNDASFFALCRTNGDIIDLIENKESLMEANVNVLDGTRKLTSRKENADALERMFSSGESGVILVNINGASYAVASAMNRNYSGVCFVSFYNAQNLYSSGYELISIILTSVVVMLLFLLIFAVYFIFSKRSLKRTISEFGTKNEDLQCLTLIGFEREAGRSLERYRGSKFAVISAGIRRFEYISEVSGQKNTQQILKRVRDIISGGMQIGETFGYDSQGEFLILMQYGQYEMMVNRLHEYYHAAYNALTTPEYNVKLNFGICAVGSDRSEKVHQLVSNAKLAMNNGGLEKMGGNYTLYEESIRDTYLKISDIEVKMDQGIRNHEFRVFYQPKYNVKRECMDGCEALVRWYDPEKDTYRPPDSFLPMLEANGFISRLDHYVFLEVCKFISNCVANGTPIIPVSVNVSRLTALEPDFVDYYVKLKRQYQIPNHFITLEFTESVAYENYTSLSALVKKLRDSGFECSIDDFGTGYSSYNMLKLLEIDEVKLDKFFIEGCLTSQRARFIVEGAVSIANNLKIKVTQEGVEDEKTFQYLKDIGCNVIQGYYYSRPLKEEAFLDFIQEHLHWKEQ